MLDLKFIRENSDAVKMAAKNKQVKVDIGRILDLDAKRRDLIQVVDNMRSEQNKASEIIAKEKDSEEKKSLIAKMRDFKNTLEKSEGELAKIAKELADLQKQVPNIPFENVPIGKSEKDNVVIKEAGDRPEFDFAPKDYLEIAKIHDWIDIERASKVSGSRFGYIKGELALLEFAIIRYALDLLTSPEKLESLCQMSNVKCQMFTPILPPVIVKPEHMEAMGFLTRDIAEDMYYLEKDNMYLVGTSEQSIGPMHADEVFDADDLPVRYAGFSTCFRREAGSYGKDTKGILRVHQFDKVEMVSFCDPDKSRDEHKFLLSINETMMQELGLPYRVMHISTGDMGLSKAEQFDIETWIPSESAYRETHSASNTTDFQSRRLNIKYKLGPTTNYQVSSINKSQTNYVHMQNATAFAIGRTLIAIMENYQTKDGKIKIPKPLQGYMAGSEIPARK